MLSTPLRQITGLEIWRYVTGVFLTIGNESDFRYFLPRILEISTSDRGAAVNPEIVIGKLGRAGWKQWPAHEQEVLQIYLDALFEMALSLDLDDAAEGYGIISCEAEAVMCGAAIAGVSLDRWLARLQMPDAAPVLKHLRSSFPRKPTGFWEDAPDGHAQVCRLLDQ